MGQTAQALLKETEKLLEHWKHPDPYCHPTAPGGGHCHDPALQHWVRRANPTLQDPSTRETFRLRIWIVSCVPLSQFVYPPGWLTRFPHPPRRSSFDGRLCDGFGLYIGFKNHCGIQDSETNTCSQKRCSMMVSESV